MSQADRLSNPLDARFHPVSHYASPDDVLRDCALSTGEKRVILSSWASDMYAVESFPALREVPGIAQRMRLEDILGALRQLDDEDDPPPRGGAVMRLSPHISVEAVSGKPWRFAPKQTARTDRLPTMSAPGSRWTREANVRRYRKLLATRLTDHERCFVERRLAEELRG